MIYYKNGLIVLLMAVLYLSTLDMRYTIRIITSIYNLIMTL
jgi:hypothetical protein